MNLLEIFGQRDAEVLEEARRRFAAHWEDPAEISSDYKTSLYKMVLRAAGNSKAEYERILKSFYDTSITFVLSVF